MPGLVGYPLRFGNGLMYPGRERVLPANVKIALILLAIIDLHHVTILLYSMLIVKVNQQQLQLKLQFYLKKMVSLTIAIAIAITTTIAIAIAITTIITIARIRAENHERVALLVVEETTRVALCAIVS